MARLKQTGKISTITYLLEDGFYVDIVNNRIEDQYDAWLGHKNYGVKEYIIGCPKRQENGCYTFYDFKELIEYSIDDEIELFRENYF